MPRAGRNEPCPCGSGRKVKRCCGQQRGPSNDDL
ncbi:MAG: SEC-C domain-containing protein, partial [Actinobacteria bacterium]|nr:SEC-C domain-containing protein [Actinomycetota bacterium]